MQHACKQGMPHTADRRHGLHVGRCPVVQGQGQGQGRLPGLPQDGPPVCGPADICCLHRSLQAEGVGSKGNCAMVMEHALVAGGKWE
jgi:hypothetical protein